MDLKDICRCTPDVTRGPGSSATCRIAMHAGNKEEHSINGAFLRAGPAELTLLAVGMTSWSDVAKAAVLVFRKWGY